MQTQRAILDIRLGFVGPLLPPAKEQQPLIDGLCQPLQACCDGNRGLAGRAQFEQPAVPHVLFLFRSMTGCQLAFRLATSWPSLSWPSSVAFPLPACGHRPRCWHVTHPSVCRRCWSRFLRSCNWLTLLLCLKQLLERRFVMIFELAARTNSSISMCGWIQAQCSQAHPSSPRVCLPGFSFTGSS